ncbi:MAG: phosphonate metabolism protein/1,5-bisphosphokinase (PRPP-forming) PhnN [Brachymonas sp.]|nr:phosphonate metabolism protein/1,5-bisphosphokinase (PRPP-forming) PhnN [Brachymonas sp.]
MLDNDSSVSTQRLVYCMGPSGAGKDSLLAWLQDHTRHLHHLHWARRTIARDVQTHGEQHEVVSEGDFLRLLGENAFAMHWSANHMRYGIRHAELAPLQQGHWVLVNGSREYWPEVAERFANVVLPVYIDASPDVIRQRLLARGRETLPHIEQRMARNALFSVPPDGIHIRNDSTLDAAGNELLRQLQQPAGFV